MNALKPLALACVLLASPAAHATISVFDDKSTFLITTGATQATQPYPANPWPEPAVGVLVSGPVTLTAPAGMYVGNYSTRLGYDVISINDLEHLGAAFDAPVYAFGFDFVEPEFDEWVNAPFSESTFTVTLLNGPTVVDSFQFNAPNDTAAFVGAWSTSAFDRVSIIETVGGIENEMYGQFYSGMTAMPVPEPETYALMLAGLGLVSAIAKRRRISQVNRRAAPRLTWPPRGAARGL